MPWIVMGSKNDKIGLVSKGDKDIILPIWSFLTIEDGNRKFILRVEDTTQTETYNPSPLIADLDLTPLTQDQKCKNVIYASRILEYPEREDGNCSFILPQKIARKSNQEEVYKAFGNEKGMPVFPATIFARNCQTLRDDVGKRILANIPDDMFFHQTLITGSTGSGKTVAMKYMAQYFVEEFEKNLGGGAVLAINVKEEDLLKMDKASKTTNEEIKKEWSDLGLKPRAVETFRIYSPGSKRGIYSKDVDVKKCEKITLNTENIDPETLSGLLQNISDPGADKLPGIFRYWKKYNPKGKMVDFVSYFGDPSKNRMFQITNIKDEDLPYITIHPATYQNINNALMLASAYFDAVDAKELTAKEVLQRGKFSVIDVQKEVGFGSVLLRDILEKIYNENSRLPEEDRTPILILIDEVHKFYNSSRSREALENLSLICREGRSLRIGVIFASQNPNDMPDIDTVVNTKIHFKPQNIMSRYLNGFSPEGLKRGYAIVSIHEMSQLKLVKFPLSLAGVING